MEDEHLDFADRGHGRLARLVGQQAVLLEHGLVQAGPVVCCARSREAPGALGGALVAPGALGGALGLAPRCTALSGGAPGPWHAGALPGLCRGYAGALPGLCRGFAGALRRWRAEALQKCGAGRGRLCTGGRAAVCR
eukprot:scaffold38935_cov63-Phaeocystis_antarctica.AAC.1